MAPWLDRFTLTALSALSWLGRLYGLFFLAFAVLFFYWSGRGLLAYTAGMRVAWSDPVACVAGLVAGILSLWVGVHVVRGHVPAGGWDGPSGKSPQLEATLEEALKLEKTDPAAARQLLDNYFMREAAATDARRADLRRRAAHDLNAAIALRQELQDELSVNARARRDLLASVSEDHRPMLTQIDEDDHQLQSEILQLGETIERLKLR